MAFLRMYFIGLTLVLGTQSCGDGAPVKSASLALPFTSAPSFARTETCADCHASIVESYSQTAMARAMGPVSEAELAPLSKLGSTISPSGFDYGVFAAPNGAGFVVGETHDSFPNHAIGSEIRFAIGAGVRDRSFAVAHGIGTNFAPIEVISHAAGRELSLSPFEMMHPGQRFGVGVTPDCLSCHTDSPAAEDFPLNVIPPSFEASGISCAACHGKAKDLQRHVQVQEADLAGLQTAQSDPIIRLAQLERNLRMSTCAACHLQGDARIQLQNQNLGGFEVGVDLMDQRALFVAAAPSSDVGFVSQTERLVLSACYQATDLDCSTCHNPHKPLEPKAAAASCLGCHAADQSCSRTSETLPPNTSLSNPDAPADCVTCHMPLTGVFDVAAVKIHDHFIQRRPEPRPAFDASNLRSFESQGGGITRFLWPGTQASSPGNGLHMMALAGMGMTEQAAAMVDVNPDIKTDQLAMYHHLRGSVLMELGRVSDAAEAYQRALDLDPKSAASAMNLGDLLTASKEPKLALELLNGYVRRFPRSNGLLRNRALAHLALGNQNLFATDLERAFSLGPTPQLAQTLSQVFGPGPPAAQIIDPAKAQRYRQIGRELQPQ